MKDKPTLIGNILHDGLIIEIDEENLRWEGEAMTTREEALKALEGCWDGIEKDGLKIQDLIEAHFEMVERMKRVKEAVDNITYSVRIPDAVWEDIKVAKKATEAL